MACSALLSAFIVQISGASAAVVSQGTTTSNNGGAPERTPARTSNARWSLPFDGRLSGDAVDNATTEKQHPGSVTVLHLDQNVEQQPETPAMPSAVTLTPPPSAQLAAPPAQVPLASTKNDTSTSVEADSKTPVQCQPSAQPSKAAPDQDDQTSKLRPPIGEQSLATPTSTTNKLITGEVSAWQEPINVDHIINHLVDKNFAQSEEAQKLDEQLKHLSSPTQKAISVAKDSLNDALGYQGFDPSARVGKLILDENYKVRNKAWAEYERQKYVDKIHLQVVSGMMQIAEALGMNDTNHAAQVLATGQDSLNALIGKDEAGRTVQGLKAWLNHIPPSKSNFSQTPWNTIERNKKLESVLKEALKQDPVVSETINKLEYYARPGKLRGGASRVVETTLSAISILGPGFAIPVGAEVLDASFKQATGGSEENKLEREMLLDKRIQSRLKVLSQEAALALDNYRFALVTKNPSLLVFSEEVLGNMTGRSNLPKILSADACNLDSPEIAPEIKESKQPTMKWRKPMQKYSQLGASKLL